MVEKPVKISVLSPAYNEEAHIGPFIESVRKSFAALGRKDYELIVCDNNSTDATAERARELGARVVFEPHNQIARARNTAARAARGEWFVFIDSDSRLNPELLRRTVANLESGKVCGGGARVRMNRESLHFMMAFGLRLWDLISRGLRLAPGSYVYCLREAWETTGGFDERYYASEEIAFSRSVRRWGKPQGLHFEIIADAAVDTSARKAEQYTPMQMLGQMLRFALTPWSVRRRERCGFWYSRK